MFGKKYNYFVSFWYQLNNSDEYFGSSFFTTLNKVKKESDLSLIRKFVKEEIESQTNQNCNCVIILNIKKI